MDQKTEYNKQVGERVRQFRKAKGITQLELLETIGSKSLENERKANYISMIEHGKRGLTEANIRKIAEKYGVLPGYFRLETNHMTEAEELQANNKEFFSAQNIRKQYFQMILSIHGYKVSFKEEDCIITDMEGHSTEIDRDSLLELISDFESHFAFQIQRSINRKEEKKRIEETDRKLLAFTEV